jgi:3-methyladenine DNA glycosylase AlkD
MPKPTPNQQQYDVGAVLALLEQHGSSRTREGMARYGIVAEKAFGVTMATMRQIAKRVGRNHELALGLWKTGVYEARMITAFIAEPERVTPALMDRWARDFDNWAVCDTLCFALFDRTPHAWTKVAEWCGREEEFVKRAGFALLASLVVHDKQASDAQYRKCLPLIARGANDDRNFVKKSVNWALRTIGKRSLALNASASEVARKLAGSNDPAPRWVGKDALRELTSAAVQKRLAKAAAKKR